MGTRMPVIYGGSFQCGSIPLFPLAFCECQTWRTEPEHQEVPEQSSRERRR